MVSIGKKLNRQCGASKSNTITQLPTFFGLYPESFLAILMVLCTAFYPALWSMQQALWNWQHTYSNAHHHARGFHWIFDSFDYFVPMHGTRDSLDSTLCQGRPPAVANGRRLCVVYSLRYEANSHDWSCSDSFIAKVYRNMPVQQYMDTLNRCYGDYAYLPAFLSAGRQLVWACKKREASVA